MTWQFGEPRIRLEVLGKYQITTVLGMTYFAVILALLSGIYELRIGTSYRERTGAPCSIEQSHILQKNTGCTTISGNFEQWTGRLDDWSVLYGAFELLLSVTPSEPLPRDRHLGYTVQLYGAKKDEEEGTWRAIRTLANMTRTLRCRYPPPTPCTDILLFSRADISCFCRDQLIDFQRFQAVVTYSKPGPSPLDYNSTVTYYFMHKQTAYQTIQMIARWGMVAFTLVVVVAYVQQHCASGRGFYDLLPEQRYVMGLLVATVVYQNPLHGLVVMLGSVGLLYTSRMLVSGAFASMLMLLLFIFDSIKRHGGSRRTLDFYLAKLIYGFLYWGVEAVLQTLKLTTYDPDVEEVEEDSVDAICIMVLGYTKVGLLLLWVVWVVGIWVATSRHLRKLPYLKTRFRQLPFRYFILQGWCVLVFLAVTAAYNIARSTVMDMDSGQNLLGVVFIISIYNYLLAYVYLPPYPMPSCSCGEYEPIVQSPTFLELSHQHEQEETPGVVSSIQARLLRPIASRGGVRSHARAKYSPLLARWLFGFSIQAYYDPPGHITASGWGPVDDWVQVVGFVSDHTTDTHVLLAKHGRRLVVAFRGSSSRSNWVSNLKFKQVHLPSDINPTTRFSALFPTKVHWGFWEAYSHVRDGLLICIKDYLSAPENRHTEVFVTGHSLGGALATFAAFDLTMQLGIDLSMYNFGSPRVGNHFFVLNYDAAVPRSYRIVYDGDVVAGVPMAALLYRHVGTEIVVDKYGNTIVDPTFVERAFRAKGKRRIEAHLCSRYEEATLSCLRQIVELAAEHDAMTYPRRPLEVLHQLDDSEFFTSDELLGLAGLDKGCAHNAPTITMHEDEVENIAYAAVDSSGFLLATASGLFTRTPSFRTDRPFEEDDLIGLQPMHHHHLHPNQSNNSNITSSPSPTNQDRRSGLYLQVPGVGGSGVSVGGNDVGSGWSSPRLSAGSSWMLGVDGGGGEDVGDGDLGAGESVLLLKGEDSAIS